ncbi:MAG: trehalose-phosphatase [Bacteroidetes bacterium]|nr:trehalose-phosphatase [Bacteroidota bacterium]
MSNTTDFPDLDHFFEQLRGASRRLLMLDYDGTLAPFTPERDRALPYPSIVQALHDLFAHPQCRTVLVSGRSVADLLRLLPVDTPPEIWGSHGWERRRTDGSMTPPPLDDETADVLEREWQWLESMFPTSQIERKPASVALHWRGYEPEVQATLRSLASKRWRQFPDEAAVERHPFSGGLELRAAGKTKADAVRALLAEYEETPVAAYLGDDRTDEDAFAALEGRGLRVLVRPEPRETLADVHLRPPDQLLQFLEQWLLHLS